MKKHTYFYDNYLKCRKNFISKATNGDFKLTSYLAPFKGAEGESLHIDEILVNPGKSKELLIITSGVHGVEGYIGSGCQSYFLEELVAKYEKNSFLLVHSINPYGFSFNRRVNENNVDINRNFVEEYSEKNPDYQKYNQILAMDGKKRFRSLRLILFIIYSILKGKKSEVQNAISGGQYSFKNGLFYGGCSKEWSVVVWEKILQKYEKEYSALHLLDIHTGLGERGVGYLLNQNVNSDHKMNEYFEEGIININNKNDISSTLTGTLASTIVHENTQNTSLVLEFGTFSPVKVLINLCRDNWFNEQESSHEQRVTASQNMKNCFYINEEEYKGKILERFKDVLSMYMSYIRPQNKIND